MHDGVTLCQFLAGREKVVRTRERTALSERAGRGQTSKVKNTFFVVRPPDLQACSSRWVKCGLWTTQGPKGNLEIFILLAHLISLSITSESIKAGRTGFPGVRVVNHLPAQIGGAGDAGSIPGSGRSPGGGHGSHSSILAWETPWTEEPDGLPSVGSHRVGHN